jgi:hypothetical protein
MDFCSTECTLRSLIDKQLDQHYESPFINGLETPSVIFLLKLVLFAHFHVALGVHITSLGNFFFFNFGCETLEHVACKNVSRKEKFDMRSFLFIAAGKLLHNEKVGSEFCVVCDALPT